jgi:cysteinyl-tRNA synthetase, unknown class
MNSKNIQFLYFFIGGLIIIFLLSCSSCTGLNDSLESGILYNNNGNNENNTDQTDNEKKVTIEQNGLLISENKSSENKKSEPFYKSDSKLICVLQDVDYKMLASTDFNIAIVDPDDSKLTKKNIFALHSQNKALIAYLSIGEAENYRNYWQDYWEPGNPVFLDMENPNWKGNFKVKYWYSDWQKIVFDSLLKIIDKGYDGVYLDVVDAYDYFDGKGYSDTRLNMVNFVMAISNYAKNQYRDFLIVPQNSEELIVENGYLNAIDGVGRENLWFLCDSLQDKDELAISLGYLNQIIEANKFVFAIDYCQKEENIENFMTLAQKYGFIPYIGPRELDSIEHTIKD